MGADTTVPYAGLSPERILEALESVGLQPDGRLLALNSYENRVYQVGMEEGAPLVAKFYRPGRWTREAILEEHRFVQQLADAEIPAVPPLAFVNASAGKSNGDTLPEYGGFAFAVSRVAPVAFLRSISPIRCNGWGASSAASMRWAHLSLTSIA